MWRVSWYERVSWGQLYLQEDFKTYEKAKAFSKKIKETEALNVTVTPV